MTSKIASSSDDNLECAICLQQMHEKASAETQTWGHIQPCGHPFHATCIKRWMIEQTKTREDTLREAHLDLLLTATRLDAVWYELVEHLSNMKAALTDLNNGKVSPSEVLQRLLHKRSPQDGRSSILPYEPFQPDDQDEDQNEEENEDQSDDQGEECEGEMETGVGQADASETDFSVFTSMSTRVSGSTASFPASPPSVPSVVPPRPPAPTWLESWAQVNLTVENARNLMHHKAGLLLTLLIDQVMTLSSQREKIMNSMNTQPCCPCCRVPICEYMAHQVSTCAHKPPYTTALRWKRWLERRDVEIVCHNLRICDRRPSRWLTNDFLLESSIGEDTSCTDVATTKQDQQQDLYTDESGDQAKALDTTQECARVKRTPLRSRTLWIRYEPPEHTFETHHPLGDKTDTSDHNANPSTTIYNFMHANRIVYDKCPECQDVAILQMRGLIGFLTMQLSISTGSPLHISMNDDLDVELVLGTPLDTPTTMNSSQDTA